jgi:hypothetical protein
VEKKLKLGHGNWVVGEGFWNREHEIARFTELLDEGAHILLVAPRRMGKTSIMREVERLISNRYICLQVDLQQSYLAADALAELCGATRPHRKLWEKTKDLFRNVMDLIKENVESLQISELILRLRSGLTAADWRAKGDRLLANLADSDRPVIIFLDEIAILINRMLKGSDYKITSERLQEVEAFMSWLRENSIRHKGKLRIVLTGSIGIEPILRQANLSATLNTFLPFDLPPWDAETAIGCLQALANQYGIKFHEGVCERMVERLGCCIPHHVQIFFDKVYTECKFRNQTEVKADFVDKVYRQEMLGVRGHAELSHLEERLKMVLGTELYPLALELLTETAVVGRLTADTATYLCQQYQIQNMTSEEALKEILEIFKHDGYLKEVGTEFQFESHLLRDWWEARFKLFYTPVSVRRDQK